MWGILAIWFLFLTISRFLCKHLTSQEINVLLSTNGLFFQLTFWWLGFSAIYLPGILNCLFSHGSLRFSLNILFGPFLALSPWRELVGSLRFASGEVPPLCCNRRLPSLWGLRPSLVHCRQPFRDRRLQGQFSLASLSNYQTSLFQLTSTSGTNFFFFFFIRQVNFECFFVVFEICFVLLQYIMLFL